MADTWYYTSQGQQQRPASAEGLRRYADRGLLRPRDLVWKEGMRRWVPAYTVPEFGLRPPHGAGADGWADGDGAGAGRGARVAVTLGVLAGLVVVAAVVVVLVLLARRSRPATATTAAEAWERQLAPGEGCTWEVEFTGGRQAQVWVVGQGTTNVELRVNDGLTGQLVAESTDGFSDHRIVTWHPPTTRMYVVRIDNRDLARPNKVQVRIH